MVSAYALLCAMASGVSTLSHAIGTFAFYHCLGRSTGTVTFPSAYNRYRSGFCDLKRTKRYIPPLILFTVADLRQVQ